MEDGVAEEERGTKHRDKGIEHRTEEVDGESVLWGKVIGTETRLRDKGRKSKMGTTSSEE